MTIISDFISRVISAHKTAKATEYSHRPALNTLFSGLGRIATGVNLLVFVETSKGFVRHASKCMPERTVASETRQQPLCPNINVAVAF